MKQINKFFILFLFPVLFPLQVYAGDNPCMVSAVPSGFETFILGPLYLFSLIAILLLILFKASKTYHFNLSIPKLSLLIIITILLSGIPFGIDLYTLKGSFADIFLLRIVAYLISIFLIVSSKTVNLGKVSVIILGLFLIVDISLPTLTYSSKTSLFNFYKFTFGEYGKFYTKYKDDCSFNYTYE